MGMMSACRRKRTIYRPTSCLASATANPREGSLGWLLVLVPWVLRIGFITLSPRADGSPDEAGPPPHTHAATCLADDLRPGRAGGTQWPASGPGRPRMIEFYLSRFLEMYLGFRRPTPKPYLTKLDILFDDEVERGAVARYVDERSHSASTLRLLEFSDFPAMSRGMVERVMRAMERVDPDHYAVLMAETT
jgi:hypothetical protein